MPWWANPAQVKQHCSTVSAGWNDQIGVALPVWGRISTHCRDARCRCSSGSTSAFVFQFGNLLSYLTVYENVGFPLALNGTTGKSRDERVLGLLERVGLRDSQHALPGELSGGEVQRVSFARAVAHRPQILLADEPTASLDSGTARDLIQLMLEVMQEQASSLIVSTHDPVVIDLADNILHLRDGRMVEEECYSSL